MPLVDTASVRIETTEAAGLLGVHPQTLYIWRKEGRGPAYVRVGRKILYPLVGLETWLAAHRTTHPE